MQGATMSRLVFYVYLYLGHDFLHPYKEKVNQFTGVNYLQFPHCISMNLSGIE